MLTLKVMDDSFMPSAAFFAEAGARGVSAAVVDNLRRKNGTATHPAGFAKTDYYSHAADSVTTSMNGKTAVVDIPKEGVALHYYGGTVLPKDGKKALAIPLDPIVQGIWPSHAPDTGDGLSVIWGKGASRGFLKDNNTGDLLWMLVRSVTLRPDPSVLPTDAEMTAAAENAMLAAWEAVA